jgi:hypothetical protein
MKLGGVELVSMDYHYHRDDFCSGLLKINLKFMWAGGSCILVLLTQACAAIQFLETDFPIFRKVGYVFRFRRPIDLGACEYWQNISLLLEFLGFLSSLAWCKKFELN